MSIVETTRGEAIDATQPRSLLAAAIFFVSGFPALIYQLTWQRALFTLYGTNIEAVTVVVAGFLFGLGLGSIAGGRMSRTRSINLLTLFGLVELIIGLFGLLSLQMIRFVGAETITLPIAETTAATLTLLFVPTLFMGASLPILAGHLVRQWRNVGQSVGILYCANTAGSAAACFVCALGLMQLAGMQGAIHVAAALNIAVAAMALIAAWRSRSAAEPGPSRLARPIVYADETRSRSRRFLGVLAIAGVLGYVSLSYEIVWFRAFEIATNTTMAFALILGAYLGGIANGSLRGQRLCTDDLSPARAAQSVAMAVLASSVLGFALLPIGADLGVTSLGYSVPMLILVFLQTSIASSAFPVLCHSGIAPDDQAGAGVSLVYLVNILGSVAGTLVTGFVLMDVLSIAQISVLLGIVGVVAAVSVAFIGRIPGRQRAIVGALGLAAAVAIPLVADPAFSGFYEKLTFKEDAGKDQFVDISETRSGVVTVDADRVVYGGGAYDGTIDLDLVTDPNLLVRPLMLSLFHPNPRRVLMIGLATGAWAQIVASHPAVERFTIVEINPGYLEIIKRYPVVSGILSNPKVDIVIDDGRRWLNRHPESRFDAIVQNTTWHYRPNVTNLLSEEYLRLVRTHLSDGGVFMYNTTGSARAQRTACEVYPYGFRYINVMAVSDRPIDPDQTRLRGTLADYRVDGRKLLDLSDPSQRERLEQILATARVPTPGDAGASELESCPDVLVRTSTADAMTDDNMGEEWRYRFVRVAPNLR
ncbi:MAG TPA: fused MFS/spermidine synthase [Stellaceae bacterium]|nr:fused MFS/spermidine synthase [Stellaceae bacterium]